MFHINKQYGGSHLTNGVFTVTYKHSFWIHIHLKTKLLLSKHVLNLYITMDHLLVLVSLCLFVYRFDKSTVRRNWSCQTNLTMLHFAREQLKQYSVFSPSFLCTYYHCLNEILWLSALNLMLRSRREILPSLCFIQGKHRHKLVVFSLLFFLTSERVLEFEQKSLQLHFPHWETIRGKKCPET